MEKTARKRVNLQSGQEPEKEVCSEEELSEEAAFEEAGREQADSSILVEPSRGKRQADPARRQERRRAKKARKGGSSTGGQDGHVRDGR